jgi:hypothetical protein
MIVLPQVAGTAPRAGVKAGDWARYVVSQHVTGNETLVKSFEAQFSAYADTSYVSLNVTAVHLTNVSLTLGIHHTDGTVASNLSTIDVSLSVNATNTPIVIMQNYPPTLSSMSNGTFFGVPRIVNSLDVSPTPGNASRYSWDENTGMLLSELFLYTVDANATNTGTFTYSFGMTSTNLWHYVPPKTPPSIIPPAGPSGLQFAELYVIVGIIASIALGVVGYALKRSPKSKGNARIGARDSRHAKRELIKKSANE